MKQLIPFVVLLTNCLAGITPSYLPISTYSNSQRASYSKDDFKGRVVNGFPAQENQFPHQVAVLIPLGGGPFNICGGSLISPDWVLTAARCTHSFSQFNLRFGSISIWLGGIAMTSFHAIVHDLYNPTILNNDVSLIRTPRHVGLSPSINLIQLPRASQQSQTFVGIRSTVSGYGIDSSGSVSTRLNWVDMRVISNSACASIYGPNVVVDSVICAEGYTNPSNQGHCGGDTGSPLTINENNVNTLIGVVSFSAEDGCDIGLPSGYMRTSHFVKWVYDNTNIPVRP